VRYKQTDKVFLFVYGTLLSEQPNNRLLKPWWQINDNDRIFERCRVGNAKLIAKTTIRAKMFTNNGHFPFIMFSNSSKDRVHGEVYEVPYSTITIRCDRLEGYRPGSPHCLYIRKKTFTKSKHSAFVYIAGERYHDISNCDPIPHGNWKTYKDGGK